MKSSPLIRCESQIACCPEIVFGLWPPIWPGSTLPVAHGVELDLVAHEVRRDALAVHLRPKEFGLLALMASHPGRAYTRQELLERVWGKGHESGVRTVDVHVRWLRTKIESDPERPAHLVTVRGVGYRLDPPER